MQPIDFPYANNVWAKDGQPDASGKPRYRPLPTFTDEKESISCWRLTWKERLQLLVSGRLWFRQMNFGRALQPISPSVESPFVSSTFER